MSKTKNKKKIENMTSRVGLVGKVLMVIHYLPGAWETLQKGWEIVSLFGGW